MSYKIAQSSPHSAVAPDNPGPAAASVAEKGRHEAGPGTTIPLSLHQELVWFRQQLHPAGALANWILVFRSGRIDPRAARQALDFLLAKHESLRACFQMENCRLLQSIEPAPELALEESDLASDLDQDGEEYRLLSKEAQRSFDLSRAPLLRAKLIRRSGAALLAVIVNPLIADAFSLRLLERELPNCYHACANGQPPLLPALRVSYGDFAAARPAALFVPGPGATKRDGSQMAGTAFHVELPADRPRTLDCGYAELGHEFAISAEAVNRLHGGGQERPDVLSILLAAYYALLARYSGRNRIVAGVDDGRRAASIPQDLIGCLEGLRPLALEISQDMLVADLLKKVRQEVRDAWVHPHAPASETGQSWRGLLNCCFSFARAESVDGSCESVSAESLVPDVQLAWRLNAAPKVPCDLALGFLESPGGLQGICYFRADLFENETIERLLRRYARIVETLASHPDLPLRQLSLELPEDCGAGRARADENFAPGAPDSADPSSTDSAGRSAARFMGLNKESRLVVLASDSKELHELANACAAASGAEIFTSAEAEAERCFPTHALVSPALLARSPKLFHTGQTTLVLYGLPCFSVVLARYQDFPVLGLWGVPPISACLAALKMDRGEAFISSCADGFDLQVLDPEGRPQSMDLWGELYVCVINAASSGSQKSRSWPTGLMARYRGNGSIAVRGYKDEIVDMNGVSVDPEWLRMLFCQHPAVENARIKVQTESGQKYLIAHIVPRTGRKLEEKELSRCVVERLGLEYRPHKIVIGQTLPAGETTEAILVRHVSPRTPAEAIITRIWRQILKKPQYDVHASFFDQGNSLTAVAMVNEIRNALHVTISLPRLFESPTIAALAKFAESESAVREGGKYPGGHRVAP